MQRTRTTAIRDHLRDWRWHVSALFYRFTYVRIAHQLDDDLFSYLGPRINGAIIADCGCGPGIVVEKFVRHGAARVFAIDQNVGMLRQVQARVPAMIDAGRVVVVHRIVDGHLFADLQSRLLYGRGFDIILFKRSLYMPPPRALPVLQAAVAALNPNGIVVVVHPARSLRQYALDARSGVTSYTGYHLVNRALSRIGEWLGAGAYTLYRPAELLELMRRAAGSYRVAVIPSRQHAYHLIAIHKS